MFPREHRVTRRDFPKGRSRIFATTDTLSLQAFPGGDTPRVTVVVSGKVSKKAVDRNTIKRHIREEVKKFLSTLTPGRYVFYVKKTAESAGKKVLRQDTQTLLTKIHSKL